MTKPYRAKILVDARELIPGRMTGIGRMLTGFVAALAESHAIGQILLALPDEVALPALLKGHECIASIKIPASFLGAERAISKMTSSGYAAFISPYPKLPLFGTHCPTVHTIHDVLDLANPLYRNRPKNYFDRYRLKKALRRADLTWYDSRWSMKETENLSQTVGKNPRVRYLGVDDRFNESFQDLDQTVLDKYGLKRKGYILAIGNGLPHKNLGLLLEISDRVPRKLLFAGVSKHNQSYWEKKHPFSQAQWIEHVEDEEIPALLRHAFCLAQPSLAEGYGYPPLEAMACGTPAVVSNIEVLIETTGGNALTGGPHDGQSWIEAFEGITNEDVYHEQVEKGHQWIANLKGRKGWRGHVADIGELIVSHP